MSELPQPPRFDPNAQYIKGIPYPLPPGEQVLWQGGPEFLPLVSHVFHIRLFVLYLVGLTVAQGAYVGSSRGSVAAAQVMLPLVIAGGFVLAFLVFYAALTASTSWYAITSRRVILKVGVALTVTVNLPLRLIASAGVRTFKDESGEVAFPVVDTERLSVFQLWPHWRPLGINRPVPQMRGLTRPHEAAKALQTALEQWAAYEAATVAVAELRVTPQGQQAVERAGDGFASGEMAVVG